MQLRKSKVSYLVIYPDFLELPVDIYFNIKDLAKHVGVSVEQMEIIIDNGILIKNRYYERVITPKNYTQNKNF